MSEESKPIWAPQPSVEDERRMYEEWLQEKEHADQKQKKDEATHVIIIDI